HDAATDEDRKEVADYGSYVRCGNVQHRSHTPNQPEYRRQLNEKLQSAAHNRTPGDQLGKMKLKVSQRKLIELARMPAKSNQRHDDGHVPDNRGSIRKKKATVAVQHSQAP